MSFIDKNWMLILMFVVSGALLLWPLVRGALSPVKEIGTLNATRLINQQNAVLLDVREADEFDGRQAAQRRAHPAVAAEGARWRARQADGAAGGRLLRSRAARPRARGPCLRSSVSPTSICSQGGFKAWKDAGPAAGVRRHMTMSEDR